MKCFHIMTMIVSLIVVAVCTDADVAVLRAVRGQDARLPCGQGKVFLDGPASYIMWVKNEREVLYRYPNEDYNKGEGDRERCFPSECEGCCDHTSLVMKKVSDSDGGLYHCRVHYQASPSVDYIIEVKIVAENGYIPDHRRLLMRTPRAWRHRGAPVNPSVLPRLASTGPRANNRPFSSCSGSPGVPRIYTVDENGAEHQVNRSYLGPTTLGSNITLLCKVLRGGKDTLVYWRRNDEVLDRTRNTRAGALQTTLQLINITRSELDATYECLSQNSDISGPLSTSVTIKMYLPPLSVEIRVNKNFDFEVGTPRMVDCVVIGCVPPPTITWHLGERLLRPQVHKEVHSGNYTVSSLSLAPSLAEHHSQLRCRAHNPHIDLVFQHMITLNVGYKPRYVTQFSEQVGAVGSDPESITCTVDAQPEPFQFLWTLPNDKTLLTAVKQKVEGAWRRYTSALTWVPGDELGALRGRATNTFGEQTRACEFMVVPGGPPQAPHCTLHDNHQHADQMQVHCEKGWNGGRPQQLQLEVVGAEGVVLQNLTDVEGRGRFVLSQLPAKGCKLVARVYAFSTRGRSTSVLLQLQVQMTPTNTTEPSMVKISNPSFLLEVLLGLLSPLLVGLALVVCAYVMTRRRRSNPPALDGGYHREPDPERDVRYVSATHLAPPAMVIPDIIVSRVGPCKVPSCVSLPPQQKHLLCVDQALAKGYPMRTSLHSNDNKPLCLNKTTYHI